MVRIILNTIKLLMKKKSFIAMGIVAPALVIFFFSFAFGTDMNYKVGIIDKDNSYISNEILKTINNIENVDIVDISKDNYEILLATHQIQIAIIIENGFERNMLNLENDEIIIKSISNSDIKGTLVSIIKSKVENLSLIAKLSNNNIKEFKNYNEEYTQKVLSYNINKVKDTRPSIEYSIGIVIMMVLISGVSIANFLIEDEENNTKSRVLASGINGYKYYTALLLVFYLLSSISSIIYYLLCNILNLDFNMDNPNNFLIVMLLLNLVSISLNLCIVSFTRNRYIASTVNILIVIPTCMLSGVFWDFDVMPIYIQKLGGFLPQRWIYLSIEKLQNHGGIEYIYEYIFYMLIMSLILFSISLTMFKVRKYKNE